MTKFNEAIAVSICEYLCGHSVVTNVCRAHGISNSTFWEWIAKSRRDELPPITWLEMEAPFWQHVTNAKRIFSNNMLDVMTERARHGSQRRITYQGKECFAVRTDIPPDPTLDADPDVMEMLYGCRDRYLRDAQGHLVHLTEKIEPPVALQLAVAAANFEAYQPHSSQSIEVTQRGEMGVKMVGGPPKPEPIKIEHKPEPDEAETFTNDAEMPVDVPDRVKASPFYKPPPPGSSKQPQGPVPVFRAEAVPDDPPEVIGSDAEAAPADAPMKPAPIDVQQLPPIREAKRRIHDSLPARNAIENQIYNALQFNMTPEARDRRLRELTGTHLSAEDRSEGLGAGPRPSGPVRVV